MRRDEPEAYFARQDPSGKLLERKREWLDKAPELCLGLSAEGEKLVKETWALGRAWGHLDTECEISLQGIGRQWEADWLYLDSETFTLAGGCVCFPSSWNLQESTGKTLDQVHGVVPGLQEQIGERINRFLQRLPQGHSFLRENWGLTRTADLNYHPELNCPRIEGPVPLEEIYLRIEHQSFLRLPSGILMGIRINPVSLRKVIHEAPETARRLAGLLSTMPGDVALYKGLESAMGWVPESLLGALGDSA